MDTVVINNHAMTGEDVIIILFPDSTLLSLTTIIFNAYHVFFQPFYFLKLLNFNTERLEIF